MKRKVAWLLALAVPLIGIALVWRSGQQRRVETDIYEAALRAMFPRKIAPAGPVFISLEGSDPSLLLLARLNRLNNGVTPFLPASHSVEVEPHEPRMGRVFRERESGREGWLLQLSRIDWPAPNTASVSINGGDTGGTYTLQHRNGNWEVKARETWSS